MNNHHPPCYLSPSQFTNYFKVDVYERLWLSELHFLSVHIMIDTQNAFLIT